jgi:hypothetical protein
MPRRVVPVVLIAGFVSCAPKLSRQEVIHRGDVDCGQGVDVWEGVNTTGQAAGCIVSVRLTHASSACVAKLWKYAGPGAAFVPVASQPDAADPTIQVTERISKLRVSCDGEAAGEKCKYEIVKVVCDDNPGGVEDRANMGDAVARVQPPCGGELVDVWSPEPGEQCRVTILGHSSDDCELVLSSAQAQTLVRLPIKARRIVTVVDPGWVKAKCDGSASTQKCLAAVVSTECR